MLLHDLEKRVRSTEPKWIDCKIIDGFFYLHLLVNLPDNFGKISNLIFRKLCYIKAKRIDVVFDRFVTPSIKDFEQDRRADVSNRNEFYEIVSPLQKRPTNFLKALQNDNF